MIDYEIENELQPIIDKGERVQWTGRPKTGLRFRASDYAMLPFSLMWGGFAIFWECMVFLMGAPLIFKIWGIPFVLVGLYLIIGRFFWDAKSREGTRYAITDQRIIISSGVFKKEIQSINIKTLPTLTYEEHKDNTGTISLGPAVNTTVNVGGKTLPGFSAVPRLDLIDDPQGVYSLLVRLQRK